MLVQTWLSINHSPVAQHPWHLRNAASSCGRGAGTHQYLGARQGTQGVPPEQGRKMLQLILASAGNIELHI